MLFPESTGMFVFVFLCIVSILELDCVEVSLSSLQA